MQSPTPADVAKFVTSTFPDCRCAEADGDYFFFAGSEENFPFATIVVKDTDFDHLSDLNRDGVFRLNIGLEKATFRELFSPTDGSAQADPTVLGKLIPHPAYAKMYWVSLLNPSMDQLTEYLSLLKEAHDLQLSRSKRREGVERSREA